MQGLSEKELPVGGLIGLEFFGFMLGGLLGGAYNLGKFFARKRRAEVEEEESEQPTL